MPGAEQGDRWSYSTDGDRWYCGTVQLYRCAHNCLYRLLGLILLLHEWYIHS